jgi:hypothetical protein
MRRLFSVVVVLLLAITLGSVVTSASPTALAFGDSLGLSDSTTFTAGAGGTLTMSVGDDGFGAWWGQGVSAIGDYWANFSFNGALTLTPGTGGAYAVSGPLVDFTLFASLSDWLTGTLNLLSFSQVNEAGIFNSTATANLLITGSSGFFASLLGGAGGEAKVINVILDIPDDLASLGLGDSADDATFSTAEVVPVPEPGSMLLLGSGLFALGGLLRRKRATATP